MSEGKEGNKGKQLDVEKAGGISFVGKERKKAKDWVEKKRYSEEKLELERGGGGGKKGGYEEERV